MNKAIIIIDVQNDYFPGGALPLWNAEETLDRILNCVQQAGQMGVPVILVQHIVKPEQEDVGFFIAGTFGVEIRKELLEALPEAPIIVKHYTDAFRETGLARLLDDMGIEEILICGMQTQNCVGLSAISQYASKYRVALLADCCTAPMPVVHALALEGFGDIIPVLESGQALKG
ncbi:MAG: isochorismatase family protein [Desulfovibrionaceae bacterium]|nr:isochorismatase family protein [Desulfovibrionaceae bacterium]